MEKKLQRVKMKEGLILKWEQNEELRAELERTGRRELGEANPTNQFWSVGYGKKDPRILQPTEWRGQNLLGKLWMEVREHVRTARGRAEVKASPPLVAQPKVEVFTNCFRVLVDEMGKR